MNISVCIITKNEALKLKKCLASLKRYDVEIVVVDTGSTDETLQVIEEYADIKVIINGMTILLRREITP